MLLLPRYFVRFLDGRMGEKAVIAFLPLDLGAHMPTLACNVTVAREYALKLQLKHKLKYEHFCIIQKAIDFGYCVRHKKNHLEFLYIDDKKFNSCFNLVLKSAAERQETWLVTFFRCRREQIDSHLKRGQLIRAHSWE